MLSLLRAASRTAYRPHVAFLSSKPFRRGPTVDPINEAITVPTALVIDDQGQKLGVIETSKALEIARSKGLDLVLVRADDPAVCKIQDFGRTKFERKKRQKEADKQSRRLAQVKDVQIRCGISDHDLERMCERMHDWLQRGHRVRIKLRGGVEELREMHSIIDEIMTELDHTATVVPSRHSPQLLDPTLRWPDDIIPKSTQMFVSLDPVSAKKKGSKKSS